MLIEFSVANYASFRERQTLSMVAAPQLRKRENTIEVDVANERLPRLLKAVAIYGPNASGKSNLIEAFDSFQDLVLRKPSVDDEPLPVQPFRFDPNLLEEPSEFEVHFVNERCRYSFEVSATPDRIHLERLVAYPGGRHCLLYERRRTALGELYKFGDDLEGGAALHDIWRKATGPKMLFISQAIANSSEEFTQLLIPFRWLAGCWMTVNGDLQHIARFSQELIKQNFEYRESLRALLGEFDIPISGIRVDQITASVSDSASKNKGFRIDRKPGEDLRTILTHKTNLGEAEFDLDEESKGTQSLMGFWLPWTVFNTTAHEVRGHILIVDELDSSLHPNIVTELIKRFLAEVDSNRQLIFTLHNTNLMDRKLLRRDQIWLTERDENGATHLYSVYDFSGRGDEDVEKRYFEGRYRGLPHLAGK